MSWRRGLSGTSVDLKFCHRHQTIVGMRATTQRVCTSMTLIFSEEKPNVLACNTCNIYGGGVTPL